MIRMLKEEKSNEERAVLEEMQKINFNETFEASPTTILDPEDSLMKKFQRTLHSHLTKVATRLSEEIAELVHISVLLRSIRVSVGKHDRKTWHIPGGASP